MDDCDRAAKLQQIEREAAAARRVEVPQIKPNGACHYCLAPVGPRQLFCDSDCAADHDRELRRALR